MFCDLSLYIFGVLIQTLSGQILSPPGAMRQARTYVTISIINSMDDNGDHASVSYVS